MELIFVKIPSHAINETRLISTSGPT